VAQNQQIDTSGYGYQPDDYSTQPSGAVAAPVSQAQAPASITGNKTAGYQGFQAPTIQRAAGVMSKGFDLEAQQDSQNAYAVNRKSTVGGQMQGLLSRTSDYMRAAETRAKRAMARRGLTNSSIAVGAAHAAAIDAALPIAQQDAGTYAGMQTETMRGENRAREINAGMEQQTNLAQAQYEADQAKTNALAAQQEREFNADMGYKQQVTSAELAQKTGMFNAEQQNKAGLQYAESLNKESYAVLSTKLNGYMKQLDNDLAMQLKTLESQYRLAENADSVNGAIYQELVRGVSDIFMNENDVAKAKAKVKHLLNAAGYELDFAGAAPAAAFTAGGQPSQTQAPVPPQGQPQGPVSQGQPQGPVSGLVPQSGQFPPGGHIAPPGGRFNKYELEYMK